MLGRRGNRKRRAVRRIVVCVIQNSDRSVGHVNQANHPSCFPFTSLKMVESTSSEFFPKIGEVAEKTDALEDNDISEQTKGDDDEDHPVEEVESLCMNCGEQVRARVGIGDGFAERFGWLSAGYYEATVDDDPVFQRGDHYVVQV